MDGWDRAYEITERAVGSFNFLEALIWLAAAAWFARAALGRPAHRRFLAAVALVLALFRVSDFVEVRTGAWWRPWWLLTWKALCLAALLAAWAWWRRAARGSARSGIAREDSRSA